MALQKSNWWGNCPLKYRRSILVLTFIKIVMGKLIKILMLINLGFFSTQVFGQQMPQFSQYIFNGLHVNPGYAGYKNVGYIQSTYRSQWINFPGAPKTFTATADFSANEGTMGFGVAFTHDEIGPTKTTGALLTYAYHLQVGRESFLALGISGGLSDYRFDFDQLKPVDEDDPLLTEGIVNVLEPNLNVGLFYHTPKYYAGLSAYNIVSTQALENQGVERKYENFHYYLTAGAIWPLSAVVSIKPSFLIKEVAGAPTSYDINTMFLLYERFWIGGSYRSNFNISKDNLQEDLSHRNAIAIVMEIFATDNFRIGYAYDHNLNALNNLRNSSHELSVGYYLSPRNVKMRNQRWF